MRLIYSLLLSFLIISISFVILRTYGEGKVYKKRNHPLINSIKKQSFHRDPNMWSQINYLPYLEAYEEENGDLAFKNISLSKLENRTKDFQTGVLIEVVEDTKNINVLLNQFIEKHGIGERVLIASRFKNILANIRKVKPRWLTAISTNDIYIAIVLHKMFLESLAPIPGDFLLLSPHIIEKKWWSEIPQQELLRRGKALVSAQGEGYSLKKEWKSPHFTLEKEKLDH